jgi:hypothetical protein
MAEEQIDPAVLDSDPLAGIRRHLDSPALQHPDMKSFVVAIVSTFEDFFNHVWSFVDRGEASMTAIAREAEARMAAVEQKVVDEVGRLERMISPEGDATGAVDPAAHADPLPDDAKDPDEHEE